MQNIIRAARAAAVVFGIAALALLFNRLIANSGLREYFILHQLNIPGSLVFIATLDSFAYAIGVFAIAYVFAANYWRELFPNPFRGTYALAAFVAGIIFAMFLNHPAHVFLFDVYFGQPIMNGGQTSDSVVGGIFSGLRQSQSLLTLPAFATMFLTPFIEELTDRGILFKESEGLRVWQIALLSFLVFCLSHYTIGGMAKVLAVAPAAFLFVTTRIITKSFVYSAAAHAGVNIAALMKLQVW
jgi:hypothetical protein